MWLLSYPSHNEHWRETGLLAGQAALNSLVAVEALKYSLGRNRPLQGDGAGQFFQGGTSFPSEHAAAAWAVAGVIGHEYPGPLPKVLAYGLASLVSYSRIRAEQHFPADVFVGSIVGSLIAQQVYTHHHDPELGGDTWRYIGDVLRGDGQASPQNQGSPYVPLDSWVYPALDRLAGFGLVDSGFAGMRPWTRRECARLLSEAENSPAYEAHDNEVTAGIVAALEREFRPEMEGADDAGGGAFRVESVYSRTGYISGTPLRDGYHFAQTQINDFGRPYGGGWNNVTGFSTFATRRPLGELFPWRMAEFIRLAGAAPGGAANDSAGRPPSPDASGNRPAGSKPVSGARCLCGPDVFQLAGFFRAAKPFVGAG